MDYGFQRRGGNASLVQTFTWVDMILTANMQSGGLAVDALQQKYMELLEKRISQLEAAVSKPTQPATEESSDESETQADKTAEKKVEKVRVPTFC